jgi:hypothetical protein
MGFFTTGGMMAYDERLRYQLIEKSTGKVMLENRHDRDFIRMPATEWQIRDTKYDEIYDAEGVENDDD